jgi:hypothetical protein
MARLAAMETEALVTPYPQVYASDYPEYFQETYPYFTNLLDTGTYTYDSEQMVNRTYTVSARYFKGNWTANYKGALPRELYDDVATLELYLFQHKLLTTATGLYTTPPTCIHPMGMSIVSLSVGVFQQTSNTGIGNQQIGAVFVLSVPFNIDIEQDF